MNRYEKVLLTSAILAALACTSPAMAQQRKFEVPAQPAVTAIPELARQAQLQIIAPAGSLDGIQAPAIVGEMDAREALRLLLEGTGLEVKSDEGNIILLQKADAAAPERPRSGPQIGTGSLRGRVLNTATGKYFATPKSGSKARPSSPTPKTAAISASAACRPATPP